MFSIDPKPNATRSTQLQQLIDAGVIDSAVLSAALLEQQKTESLLAEILSELKLQTEILQEISL